MNDSDRCHNEILWMLLSFSKIKLELFLTSVRLISDISQHFLTINCFKSILETNGIFNYLCKEIIFVFLTEPSMIMFHN